MIKAREMFREALKEALKEAPTPERLIERRTAPVSRGLCAARLRSARGARSGCLLRNGAAMGFQVRAIVRPRTSPQTPAANIAVASDEMAVTIADRQFWLWRGERQANDSSIALGPVLSNAHGDDYAASARAVFGCREHQASNLIFLLKLDSAGNAQFAHYSIWRH
jgi:hypothetical protein